MPSYNSYQIPFGTSAFTIQLPTAWKVDYLKPTTTNEHYLTDDDIVTQCVDYLTDAQLTGQSLGHVGVVVADDTRPPVHQQMIPALLSALERCNIDYRTITYFVGGGLHHGLTAQRLQRLLPPSMIGKSEVVVHNAEDNTSMVHLGNSNRGTPIFINKRFYETDFKIVCGVNEPHQFVGLSGGAKGAAIGLAGRATITHNHSLLTHSGARRFTYRDNPVFNDIFDIGMRIGVDLYCNAICSLNYRPYYLSLWNGKSTAAYWRAFDSIYKQLAQRALPVQNRYDIVVASGGGAPKDCNLYQLQKALAQAGSLAAPNATIIVCGSCDDGVGDDAFAEHFMGMSDIEQVIEQFTVQPFVIGPHKSYLFARSMVGRTVALCSTLPADKTTALHFEPIAPTATALAQYIQRAYHTHGNHDRLPHHQNTTDLPQPNHATPRLAIIPYAITSEFIVHSDV